MSYISKNSYICREMAKKKTAKHGGWREEARGKTGPKLFGTAKRVQFNTTVDVKTLSEISTLCNELNLSRGEIVDTAIGLLKKSN